MTIKTKPIDSLHTLGVKFLAGQRDGQLESITSPEELLCALASSDEARIRLALIPLLLRYPGYAKYVQEALKRLSSPQQCFLRCYYTAAQLLQQKYQSQLNELFGKKSSLPALFEHNLDLDMSTPPDMCLQQLGKKQAQLSGKTINWYGTYEHAYMRLVRHTRRRRQWQ